MKLMLIGKLVLLYIISPNANCL